MDLDLSCGDLLRVVPLGDGSGDVLGTLRIILYHYTTTSMQATPKCEIVQNDAGLPEVDVSACCHDCQVVGFRSTSASRRRPVVLCECV